MMLGLCGTIATPGALLLFEEMARRQKQEGTANAGDGLLQRPSSSSSVKEKEEAWIVNRDFALAIATVSICASFWLESFRSDGFTYHPGVGRYDRWGVDWKGKQYAHNIRRDMVAMALESAKAITLLATVRNTSPNLYL